MRGSRGQADLAEAKGRKLRGKLVEASAVEGANEATCFAACALVCWRWRADVPNACRI